MVEWTWIAGFIPAVIIGIIVISNPISTAAIFIGLTEKMTKEEKKEVARTAVRYAVMILVFFALTGMLLFQLFGFTVGAFRIAGGVILFTTAVAMLNPRPAEEEAAESAENIALMPICIPFIAGPGTIVTVILYMSEATAAGEVYDWMTAFVGYIGVFIGIGATVFVSWLVMDKSEAIDNRLGEGRAIVTRLMGLIVMAIAIQFIINGIKDVTPEFVKIVDETRQMLMLLWY
jgi:multiple antibiotic resistance protein